MAMRTKKLVDAAKVKGEAAVEKLQESRDLLRSEFDDLLGSLLEKVTDMRSSLATAAGEGRETVEAGVGSMVKKTRKGIRDLDKRWKKLDGKQKIAIAGGLLAVLAAAAVAPTVVKKIRKKR